MTSTVKMVSSSLRCVWSKSLESAKKAKCSRRYKITRLCNRILADLESVYHTLNDRIHLEIDTERLDELWLELQEVQHIVIELSPSEMTEDLTLDDADFYATTIARVVESFKSKSAVGGARDASAAFQPAVGGARDASAAFQSAVGGARDTGAASEPAVGGARDTSAAFEPAVGGARNASAAFEPVLGAHVAFDLVSSDTGLSVSDSEATSDSGGGGRGARLAALGDSGGGGGARLAALGDSGGGRGARLAALGEQGARLQDTLEDSGGGRGAQFWVELFWPPWRTVLGRPCDQWGWTRNSIFLTP